MLKTLEPRAVCERGRPSGRRRERPRKRHEGKGASCGRVVYGSVVRRVRLPVGENLCRCKAHERHRHETRPEGLQAEQSVKRLRKPGGAAKPELVAPVLVAARCLIRWRATKPHGRVVGKRQAGRVFERGSCLRTRVAALERGSCLRTRVAAFERGSCLRTRVAVSRVSRVFGRGSRRSCLRTRVAARGAGRIFGCGLHRRA
jgi:hypothetical protein